MTDSTKKNLMMRAEAECGACSGKMDLAKKAKALNLDAIHDTVHEMAKDEARHGRGFEGLLKRYFTPKSDRVPQSSILPAAQCVPPCSGLFAP